MTKNIDQLIANLESIRERISRAAERVGRTADEIRLIGVSKYVDADTTRQLVEAGCRELGESRPQALWEKASALDDLPVTWHLIGHLQRNKVKRTIDCAHLIHSVDSQRLLQAINNAAVESNVTVNVLLEVNVSNEPAKHGFKPDEIEEAIESVEAMRQIKVNGLMCMAGLESGPESTRREFRTLKQLSERLVTGLPDNVQMSELSMGMSGDFEMAIEEGATMVRIGSLLFEGT